MWRRFLTCEIVAQVFNLCKANSFRLGRQVTILPHKKERPQPFPPEQLRPTSHDLVFRLVELGCSGFVAVAESAFAGLALGDVCIHGECFVSGVIQTGYMPDFMGSNVLEVEAEFVLVRRALVDYLAPGFFGIKAHRLAADDPVFLLAADE
jgi:hypothetical protein